MIIKVDGKQLEWRVKTFLSQDPVALQEILDNVDMHAANQEAFKLPSRLIAKKFVFRMIFADAFSTMGFRKPAYAYANDPEFSHVSESTKFWASVVERFYDKYRVMYQHGVNLIDEVARNGQIVNSTGRVYSFDRLQDRYGNSVLPHTQILNYPVQGLAAEIMALARVVLRKRLSRLAKEVEPHTLQMGSRILLMNTVHDDIELDVDGNEQACYNIYIELEKVFEDLPNLFERYFGVEFNCPLAGEVSYGPNMKELVEFKRKC